MHPLQSAIEQFDPASLNAHETFIQFRNALTRGEIRAAEKVNGRWTVNAWVKQGILLGFRLGEIAQMDAGPFLCR